MSIKINTVDNIEASAVLKRDVRKALLFYWVQVNIMSIRLMDSGILHGFKGIYSVHQLYCSKVMIVISDNKSQLNNQYQYYNSKALNNGS